MFLEPHFVQVLLVVIIMCNCFFILGLCVFGPVVGPKSQTPVRTIVFVNILLVMILVPSNSYNTVLLLAAIGLMYGPGKTGLVTWYNWYHFHLLILFGLFCGIAKNPINQLLVLEFASIWSTVLVLQSCRHKNPFVNLPETLRPVIVLNIFSYLLLLILLLSYVNGGTPAGHPLNTLAGWSFVCYIVLKVLFSPIFLYKQPVYKVLDYGPIWWLAVITCFITVPTLMALIPTFKPVTLTTTPLTVLLLTPVAVMFTGVRELKTFLLFSTALATSIMLLVTFWV